LNLNEEYKQEIYKSIKVVKFMQPMYRMFARAMTVLHDGNMTTHPALATCRKNKIYYIRFAILTL